MKRLLGETPTDKSPSTGAVEKVIQVRVEKSSCDTVSVNVEEMKWTRLTKYDDEAVEIMKQLAAVPSSNRMDVKKSEVSPETKLEQDTDPNQIQKVSRETDPERKGEPSIISTKHLVHNSARDDSSLILRQQKELAVTPIASIDPLEVFKDTLKSKGLKGLHQHLENHWSLYLSNTGGQMEFQELLPLLVSGPSMLFVTFRLDRDLDKQYEIEYEVAVKADNIPETKLFKYTSTATPIETILQTLASFDAVGTYDYSKEQKDSMILKYKVFIVGTHRDILEIGMRHESLESKITKIDQAIQKAVKDTSYYCNIEFAFTNQMIFTVDNFSRSDSEFQHIRTKVQRVIKTGDFRMISPRHWLIYSLVLRQQLKGRVESYDNCFQIARECGIASDEEHKEALHFIHNKMGLIRYFPQDDLDQVVILDPQILFDKVTELITDTFTFEKAGKHIMDDFKNGLFSFKDLEKLQDSDMLLNAFRFTKILEHLRIAVPFRKDGILKYFFPCVLSHVDRKPEAEPSQHTSIPPLVVTFGSGYRPMGLAGALITYLMTDESKSEDLEWHLSTDSIFRDQVSFIIEPSCDTVILKMYPTHLEISFLPDPDDDDRIDCPIEETCKAIWQTIHSGIKTVNSDINYIRSDHSFTFYCQLRNCKVRKLHPAKLLRGKLHCLKSKRSCKFPEGYEKWMFESLTKTDHNMTVDEDSDAVRCNSSHFSHLYAQLSSHAADWSEIGSYLGFSQSELKIISCDPLNLSEAPKGYLRAMLSQWLEWAPGDHRGSKQYATLETLKAAVCKAGLGVTANTLTRNVKRSAETSRKRSKSSEQEAKSKRVHTDT